jgi:hypothetical protein
MAADAAISAEACEAICARTGCPMHKGMMTAGKPASPKGPIQCVLDSGVGGHHAMLVLGHTLSTMPAAIFHSLPRDASEPLARLDARRPDVALQTAVPPPRSV